MVYIVLAAESLLQGLGGTVEGLDLLNVLLRQPWWSGLGSVSASLGRFGCVFIGIGLTVFAVKLLHFIRVGSAIGSGLGIAPVAVAGVILAVALAYALLVDPPVGGLILVEMSSVLLSPLLSSGSGLVSVFLAPGLRGYPLLRQHTIVAPFRNSYLAIWHDFRKGIVRPAVVVVAPDGGFQFWGCSFCHKVILQASGS